MPPSQETPHFMSSTDANDADKKRQSVRQAVEKLGTIFSDTYKVIFHDTSNPTLEESRTSDFLVEQGWGFIGYFRKYDGVRFQTGSMMDWNRQTEDLRIFSTEFEDWIMRRCKEAGRESAEFCSIFRQNQ